MKIAIIGAHGVGKTTLTKALETTTGIAAPVPTPMHNPEPGKLKSLQDCTNEEMIRLSQRRFAERIAQEQATDNVISDGSVLHEWSYASVRLSLGIFPTSTQEKSTNPKINTQLELIEMFAEEAMKYAENSYDLLFFIPIEISLPEENSPISDRFQLEAQKHLQNLLTKSNAQFTTLSGTHSERLDHALNVIEQATQKPPVSV